MECLVAAATLIGKKIKEWGRETIIGWVVLTINYGCNVENLKTETENLNVKMNDMKAKMKEERDRGNEIYGDVQKDWKELEQISEEAQQLLDATNHTCNCWRSFECFVVRCQKSKEAVQKKESVVNSKMEKIKLDHISFRPRLQGKFGNKDYKTFETREEVVDQIMEALGDDSVGKIGLHGMPGVGKTTLVQEIANKALEKDQRLFDDAVIVTVSQTPEVKEIQKRIAERLGLKFSKDVLEERALELQQRLKNEKNFLIVLDDIWSKLNLEEAGIVFESDQNNGCKILITSRFERVLKEDMEIYKNFKVELLSEDEAMNWFNVIVGDKTKDPKFKEVGNKVVNKCDRLPIAIVIVANSLKNREFYAWNKTLRQLERSTHDKKVHSAIESCYDILESDEAKQLLLFCALHEEDEDIELEYLMRYGWGQIDNFKDDTLQDTRDKVKDLVDLLKDHCLLFDGDEARTVKMHDVVRDFGISIATQSHGMHSFRDGGEVEHFLQKKKFEDLKAIMLPNGYLDELDFERSKYSQLQLMILRRQETLVLPGEFLNRTAQLKVLILIGNATSYMILPKIELSQHLSPLQNLCTLHLQNYEVEGIAEIGKLKNLEILDLSRCNNTEFPCEIGQLTCLRMLNLRGSKVEVIELNVIMQLKRLEELYLPYIIKWHEVDKVENNYEEKGNASLDELQHLDCLTTLHVAVPHINVLPKVLLGPKLEYYEITIGSGRFHDFQKISSRKLWIDHESSSLIQDHGLEMLMSSAEVLQLQGLNGMESVVSELETKGFSELKCLELKENSTVEYLVNNSVLQIHPCTVLESLEELFLEKMSHLKQICNGEVSAESFKMLRVVRVSGCDGLKKLFPFFCFRQLEEIEITDCKEVEEIFSHEIHDNGDDNNEKSIVEFTQLQRLMLASVPKLREFMSSKILMKKTCSSQIENKPFVGDPVTPLFNGKQPQTLVFPDLKGVSFQLLSFISFQNLINLEVEGCNGMLHLLSSQTAKTMTQLKTLRIRNCERMESIISDEGGDSISGGDIDFTMLEDLILDNLTSLSSIYSGNCTIEFPNLDILQVQRCDEMQSLVSSSMAVSLKQLCSLEVYDCKAMEEIVSRDETMDEISFPMLYELRIHRCPKLKTFVSESSEEKSESTKPSLFNQNFLCFPKLEKLELSGINVKKIWDDQLLPTSFSCLTSLNVFECKYLKNLIPSSMAASFKQLEYLEVKDCEAMEEIVINDAMMDKISFPKLHFVNLRYLLKLSKFSSEIFMEFPMLDRLYINLCPQLETFVSKSSSEEKSNTAMSSLFN